MVKIIRARRLKTSSTPSPVRAEISTATGIFDLAAQWDVSSELTSLPSDARVAVNLVPVPIRLVERIDPFTSHGIDDCLLEVLDGVGGGRESSKSDWASEVKSALFPARMTDKFGEARARASMRKVGREAKEA